MAFRTGDEGVGPNVSRLFRRLKDYVDSLANPEPWIPMNLGGTGWSNYGFSWTGAGYRKVGDMVQIRGLIAGGFSGNVIAVMPVGYRPTGNLIFSGQIDYGAGYQAARLDILAGGTLQPYWNSGAAAAYLAINIEYSTV